LVGLVIAATATLLARETKSLLIGERADQSIVDSISAIAETIDGVSHANGILTVHLAPNQILAAVSLEFDDDLTTPEIESKVAELENNIRQKHPSVVALFVKPQSHDRFLTSMEHRFPRAQD
jgi:divalent metal cation (Fe/Co/Zn/Cd) transporter